MNKTKAGLPDFDLIFQDYVTAAFRAEKQQPEDVEQYAADKYEEWLNAPLPDGKKPKDYFTGFTSENLYELFIKIDKHGDSAPLLLTAEISTRRDFNEYYVKLLQEGNAETCATVLNLLTETENPACDHVLIGWLTGGAPDKELCAHAVEALSVRAAANRGSLLAALKKEVNPEYRKNLLDVLVYAGNCPETLMLLKEVFTDDIILYANYARIYGDEAVIPLMKRLALSSGYYEFLELRNAVEALGGEFDIEREFKTVKGR